MHAPLSILQIVSLLFLAAAIIGTVRRLRVKKGIDF